MMVPCPRNIINCVDVEGCPLRLECLTKLLADREEQFITFWRMSPDSHCIISESGVFERISEASTAMFGHAPEQMEGHPFVEFLHPDDVVPSLDVFRELFASKAPVISFDNRYRHADGHYVSVNWNASSPVNGRMYGTARLITVSAPLHQPEDSNGIKVASRSAVGCDQTT